MYLRTARRQSTTLSGGDYIYFPVGSIPRRSANPGTNKSSNRRLMPFLRFKIEPYYTHKSFPLFRYYLFSLTHPMKITQSTISFLCITFDLISILLYSLSDVSWLTAFSYFFPTKSSSVPSKLGKSLRSTNACMYKHTFCLILLIRSHLKFGHCQQ